jgi:hypothetical protein
MLWTGTSSAATVLICLIGLGQGSTYTTLHFRKSTKVAEIAGRVRGTLIRIRNAFYETVRKTRKAIVERLKDLGALPGRTPSPMVHE